MILMPDLFSFAYVPNWYSQLDMLAEMALPESVAIQKPYILNKKSRYSDFGAIHPCDL